LREPSRLANNVNYLHSSRDLLDHEPVRRALSLTLDRIVPVARDIDFRLGGTAAALLHGVQLPVGDVDILVKDRSTVDLFSRALSDFPAINAPVLLEEAKQYFANHNVEGVDVGFSTVEWETDSEALECIGSGPWEHFSLLPCGEHIVPTVALELRLVSDVTRNRPDRYRPIAEFLGAHSYDLDLVLRGFTARRIPPERQREVLSALQEDRSRDLHIAGQLESG
jgi:hypothetical protein